MTSSGCQKFLVAVVTSSGGGAAGGGGVFKGQTPEILLVVMVGGQRVFYRNIWPLSVMIDAMHYKRCPLFIFHRIKILKQFSEAQLRKEYWDPRRSVLTHDKGRSLRGWPPRQNPRPPLQTTPPPSLRSLQLSRTAEKTKTRATVIYLLLPKVKTCFTNILYVSGRTAEKSIKELK